MKPEGLSLSRARRIQSTRSHPISLWTIVILFSHLFLDLSSDFFLLGFPIKKQYAFLISPTYATKFTHLIFINLITRIISGDK